MRRSGWVRGAMALAAGAALFMGAEAGVRAAAAWIVLTATPEAVPANGSTEAVIVARVYDAAYQPVAGAAVTFSASQGLLSATSAVTGSDGQASVLLRVYPPSLPYSAEGARASVSAVSGSAWATVDVGIFSPPHGRYLGNTNACFLCHGVHSATSPRTLKAPVGDAVYGAVYEVVYDPLPLVAPVCFTCHDGTGSIYNVKDPFSAASGNTSHHPVRAVGNAAVLPLLNCTACHNPHGDKTPQGSGVYPRLLRQFDRANGGVKVFAGPEFCLTCHGSVDRKWGGKPGDPNYYDYYTNAAGDHSNPYAVHYDTSGQGNRSLLLPPSGTKVTCVQCHDKHAARGQWLMPRGGLPLTADLLPPNGEEDVCFSCHTTHDGRGVSMNGVDIKEKFSYGYDEWGRTGPSRHDIFSQTGAKVECISCHGPHTVSAVSIEDGLSVSAVSDPDNTKNYVAQAVYDSAHTAAPRPGVTVGDVVTFCLKCHDGDPPREINKYAGNASRDAVVPYTVLFPQWLISTNAGGFNKSAFPQTGHYAQGVKCTSCHDPHGSVNPRNLLLAEDTDTANGFCLICHDGQNQKFPAAPDVRTDLVKASRHPTLYVAGKHSDREDYQNMPVADRHAECADCHDAHAARPYGGANGVPRNAPWLPGPNVNVSGVAPDYTGVPSGGTPSFAFKQAADYLYEVCFKCHTSYGWGAQTPPVAPSETTGVPQPDKAREFNVNNPSYHPVVRQGRNGGIWPGAFNPSAGVTADSQIYCTDCHGADEADANTTSRPYGAHGSANAFLLKGPATRIGAGGGGMGGSGGGVTPNEVCFRCHSYDVYYNGALDAQGNHYSRFVGSVMGGGGMGGGCAQDVQGRVSLHCFHVQQQGKPCLACHASHGTMESVVQSVYDEQAGQTFQVTFLDPAQAGDCQTPQNCWRGTKRLLAFRGAAQGASEGIYQVEWNVTDGDGDGTADNFDGIPADNVPNRCSSLCHKSNPKQWWPAYDYQDR